MPSLDLTADACSVLNLAHSDAIEQCLSGLPSTARVTPQVAKESRVKSGSGVMFTSLIEQRLLEVEPEIVGYEELEELIHASALGAGECETILSCAKTGRMVCCDDKKARSLAKKMLGEDKLIGSIGLLSRQVSDGVLTANEAYDAYMKMVDRGGFLPKLNDDYFVNAVA